MGFRTPRELHWEVTFRTESTTGKSPQSWTLRVHVDQEVTSWSHGTFLTKTPYRRVWTKFKKLLASSPQALKIAPHSPRGHYGGSYENGPWKWGTSR